MTFNGCHLFSASISNYVTICMALHNPAPFYIIDKRVSAPSSIRSGRRLRSVDDGKPKMSTIQDTRTVFGKSAFVVSGQSLWNSLQTAIHKHPHLQNVSG